MHFPCSGNARCGCKPGLAGDCPECHQSNSDGDPGSVVKGLFSSYNTKHRASPSSYFQVIVLIFNIIGFCFKKLFSLYVWSLDFQLVPKILNFFFFFFFLAVRMALFPRGRHGLRLYILSWKSIICSKLKHSSF